jgi:flagellar biogenesis protein FliO
MNTQLHFLCKRILIIVIIVFWQNINICPADNTTDSNFDNNQYGQNQQARQNKQLNALKLSVSNTPPKPLAKPTPAITSANYTTNQNNQTSIKLASAEIENNQNNNSTTNSNHTNKTPPKATNFETPKTLATLKESETPATLPANTQDQTNVIENLDDDQLDTTPDEVLDQKINFDTQDDNGKKLKKPLGSGFFSPVVSVVGSLLIVISVFLIFTFLFKKISPNAVQVLPKEVFENLGKTFISQKLQVNLLRLGNRLILVSSTNDTLTPITEITDPDEVVAVLGMCRQLNNNGINKFHQNLTSQLNSQNQNRNNNFSKNYAAKNNPNDYFGTDQSDHVEMRNYGRQPAHSIDMYSEPDKSLAAILANGIERKGAKS